MPVHWVTEKRKQIILYFEVMEVPSSSSIPVTPLWSTGLYQSSANALCSELVL
jgi:hypothetical protein